MIKRLKTLALSLILLFSTNSIASSYAESLILPNDVTFYSTLKDGHVQNDEILEFKITIRAPGENGGIDYVKPEYVKLNNKNLPAYSHNYKGTLVDGENHITIRFAIEGDYFEQVYKVYLDKEPPIFNVKGIYNNMIVYDDKQAISFEIKDNYSSEKNMMVQVLGNSNKKAVNNNVVTFCIPKSKEAQTYYGEEGLTEQKQPVGYTLTFHAIDEAGNSTKDEYHLIHFPRSVDRDILHFMTEINQGIYAAHHWIDSEVAEKTPLFIESQFSSEYGAAHDKSNITTLGTYGGYVTLSHDYPIINHAGDDFEVNASWSDQGVPLTSVMVMEDNNRNGLPDETWYFIEDDFANGHEEIDYQLTYESEDVARDKDGKKVNVSIKTDIGHVYRGYYHYLGERSYDQSSKRKYEAVTGVLHSLHDSKISSMSFETESYDLDDAIDADGNPVILDKIAFVKVYSNTLDKFKGFGPVAPAVKYVRVFPDQNNSLQYDPNALRLKKSLFKRPVGELVHLLDNTADLKVVTGILPEKVRIHVDEDYVWHKDIQKVDDVLAYRYEKGEFKLSKPAYGAFVDASVERIPTPSYIKTFSEQHNVDDRLTTLSYVELMTALNKLTVWTTLPIEGITEEDTQLMEEAITTLSKAALKRIHQLDIATNMSYNKIKKSKWMIDFLPYELYKLLPDTQIKQLEEAIQEMVGYENTSRTSLLNDTLSIEIVDGIGMNLSSTELDTLTVPNITLTEKSSILADPLSLLIKEDVKVTTGFTIDYEKNNKDIHELYNPLTIRISSMADTQVSQYKCYSVAGDALIPVEEMIINDDNTLTIKTFYTGQHYICE